ncbi:MAG: hypothetical protein AAF085_16155 [Planctomycetota bacterium]
MSDDKNGEAVAPTSVNVRTVGVKDADVGKVSSAIVQAARQVASQRSSKDARFGLGFDLDF